MGAKTERPTGKDLGIRDLEEKQNDNQKSVGFKILKHKKINLLMSSYSSLNRNIQIKHTCRPKLSIFSFQSVTMMLKIKILLRSSLSFKSLIHTERKSTDSLSLPAIALQYLTQSPDKRDREKQVLKPNYYYILLR